jgi:hypothetical protein
MLPFESFSPTRLIMDPEAELLAGSQNKAIWRQQSPDPLWRRLSSSQRSA